MRPKKEGKEYEETSINFKHYEFKHSFSGRSFSEGKHGW